MSTSAPVLAFGAGVAIHLFFFKRGERFLYPLRYVQCVVVAAAVGTFVLSHYRGLALGLAFRFSCRMIGNALAGLYSSLLIWRLFFNPLNKFPGPFMARLTKFDTVFRFSKMDGYHQLRKLHEKHGKFVRIGPNDLSVTDPDGTQVISAANSKCKKAPWYANDTPFTSMHTTRDRALHDRRRRVWSPAFSDKALRGYEERIQGYNDMLVQRLKNLEGKPINVSNLFNLYSFDVMGDLGFGKSFDMLQTGEKHWAIKLLGLGMDPLAFSFPYWFFRFLVAIPALSAGYHQFIGFCSKRLDDRIKEHGKTDPDKPDIISFLIEQYLTSENKKDAITMMQGDSRLIIVAGSDTTAAALVYLFHWLAKKPEVQERLRKELGGQLTSGALQNNKYLNALIDESLRLNPPVPSGVFRTTPAEGVHIGRTWIPGNTHIQMPTYVMGHDPDCYADPESFIPERWTTKPNLVKHKDAWGPFSTGPFGCIGKNLAYLEIRTVTAQIIQKFKVKFASGEDGKNLMMNTKDHFTLELADLNLCFEQIR